MVVKWRSREVRGGGIREVPLSAIYSVERGVLEQCCKRNSHSGNIPGMNIPFLAKFGWSWNIHSQEFPGSTPGIFQELPGGGAQNL